MARKVGNAATIRDVAELAGVSVKTVSNYLNGYQYMREETKARVAAAVEQLGYTVNLSARHLSLGRTGMISLVVPTVLGGYFAELAEAVVREAASFGLTVLLETTGGERDRELRLLDPAKAQLVDGVMFSPVALSLADKDLLAVPFPLVLLGERVFGAPVDHVTMQNIEAMKAATEHVIKLGAQSIVALGVKDDPEPSSGMLRLKGVRRAMDAHGLSLDPKGLIPLPNYFQSTGYQVMETILDSGIRPDAVVAFTDALALGAMAALAHRGIRVPQDVMVVGFDNIEEAEYSFPPLTTIDPGLDQIAREAVAFLEQRVVLTLGGTKRADQPEARTLFADFELIQRGSTAA
ncbi:MAG: LacI family transcriptional regulator [Bifidobacteriaceae bacterium]|nr:LacI family transcriptional regulator [Bifidobacteriaceae bacterium]